MAIILTKQPAEIVFSRNPVEFGFQTDNLYSQAGQASVYLLAFPLGPGQDGTAFELRYGNDAITQTFTVKNYPDDSGVEIIAGKDHPIIADLTMLQWCQKVVDTFQVNYLLSRDYTFSIDTYGPQPRVKLTAKLFDPYYNLEVNDQPFASSTQLFNGLKKERHRNFRIIYEIWIENAAHTGFDLVQTDGYAVPDDSGLASINISRTLSESLRGPLNDFDTPDPALPLAFQAKKTCRRYYIRYAEVYGEVQTVRAMQATSIKWSLLGGVGKFKQANYSVATNFLVGGLHKFLKIEPVSKSVKLTQPEWLSLIWLSEVPASIRLRVKVYYKTGDPTEVTKYPFSDLSKYDKITFPTGSTQMNLSAVDGSRIITRYEVWVEDASDLTILTEVRTYHLDYAQLPVKFIMELSSFGVYDTFQCYGKGSVSYDLTSDKAVISRSAAFTFTAGETIDFDNSLEQKEIIRTGWQTRREIARYRDLFLSWDKFLIRNGRMYPISTNTKSINEFDDDVNLYALEFEIGYRYSEELYSEEDDLDPVVSLAQYIPIISNPDPDNYDHLYYRKSQTYNQAEIDAAIADVLSNEATHHNAQAALIAGLTDAVAGKADINHNHDLDYIGFNEFNDFADAVGAALIYRGVWNPDYSVDPDEVEVPQGYMLNDRVEHAGQVWRSLEDENTIEPGTNTSAWTLVSNRGTEITITEDTTLDWQAGSPSGETFKWVQKHGNKIPSLSIPLWLNPDSGKWELYMGVYFTPTFTGPLLTSLLVSADLYPVKLNFL